VIKTILVPATDPAADAAVFATALTIARAFAAHLDALHVQLDPLEAALAMSAADGTGSATILDSLVAELEQNAMARAANARAVFTALCEREALAIAANPAQAGREASAQWHVETGQEARWLTVYGMTADLIVAARRRTAGDEAAARFILETLLLETGRPLLVPAATPLAAMPERVAIAWKPTPQAARAVVCAGPFLARAKEIVVITVEEEGRRSRDDADRLMRYLAWHGKGAVAAPVSPGARGGAAALLAAASPRADLLVMGGYGHTRLREWVFGGFTQHVLAEAPLPILIVH